MTAASALGQPALRVGDIVLVVQKKRYDMMMRYDDDERDD